MYCWLLLVDVLLIVAESLLLLDLSLVVAG